VAPSAQEIADLANTPPSIPGVTFAPSGVTACGVRRHPCPTTLDDLQRRDCERPMPGPSLKKLYTLDAVARTTARRRSA
jgi:hypothetical protein